MRIRNYICAFALASLGATTAIAQTRTTTQNPITEVDSFRRSVPPEGTDDLNVLKNAPSSEITVKGEKKYAKLVIDIRNNTLYKYDKDGNPLKAYLVATGAKGLRTKPGLRKVSYIDHAPYSGAPTSKRHRNPKPYGKHVIILKVVNPITGEESITTQFVHGNGDESSIGKKNFSRVYKGQKFGYERGIIQRSYPRRFCPFHKPRSRL